MKTKKTVWPDEVPVLVAEDVCLPAQMKEGGDKRTILSWLEAVFKLPQYDLSVFGEATVAVFDSLNAAFGYYGLSPPNATASGLARAWNKAMQMLGYDITQPDDEEPEPPKKTKAKEPVPVPVPLTEAEQEQATDAEIDSIVGDLFGV